MGVQLRVNKHSWFALVSPDGGGGWRGLDHSVVVTHLGFTRMEVHRLVRAYNRFLELKRKEDTQTIHQYTRVFRGEDLLLSRHESRVVVARRREEGKKDWTSVGIACFAWVAWRGVACLFVCSKTEVTGCFNVSVPCGSRVHYILFSRVTAPRKNKNSRFSEK